MARRRKWDPARKSGRRRQSHFMDAAMDGYVRDVALHIWREYEDLTTARGFGERDALQAMGEFSGAGPYRALWQEAWRQHVLPGMGEGGMPLYGRVETAVRDALREEHAARAERGDVTIEDTPGYKEFVARALGRLLEEASGEIEEMDE